MKPNPKARVTKKAPATKRAPRARKAPATPKVVDTAGSADTSAVTAPEVHDQQAVMPPDVTPPTEPPVAGVPPVAPIEEPSETIAGMEHVTIGCITGALGQVALDVVLGLLGQPALERIDAISDSSAVSDLAQQMRVTDGRCAPVYFTVGEDGKPPALFDGIERIAAAKVGGVNVLPVVVVASGDGDFLQSHLSQVRHSNAEAEDEDFIYRVHADDDD